MSVSATVTLEDETALTLLAGTVAQRWRAVGVASIIAGLRGELGAGKTTWVRAMLRGLGYTGRVPSPTYTLLEEYDLSGLTVVHLDLYRLEGDAELEAIGARDWLERPGVWTLAEWPERSPRYLDRADFMIGFGMAGGGAGRSLALEARTASGAALLEAIFDLLSS